MFSFPVSGQPLLSDSPHPRSTPYPRGLISVLCSLPGPHWLSCPSWAPGTSIHATSTSRLGHELHV